MIGAREAAHPSGGPPPCGQDPILPCEEMHTFQGTT